MQWPRRQVVRPLQSWRSVRADVRDLRGLAALAPLGGGYLPWTSYCIRPASLALVCDDVMVFGRRSLLELGSGTSTVVLARLLRQLGGHLTSVEHDELWLERVRRWLDIEGLADQVTLVHAPLVPSSQALATSSWYDEVVLKDAALPHAPFDLVLVDGPPAGEERDGTARFPALPFLLPHLAAGALVVLDDAHRPGETEVLRRWRELAPDLVLTPRAGGDIALGVVGADRS